MNLSNPLGTAEYGSYVRTTTRDGSRKKVLGQVGEIEKRCTVSGRREETN